MDQERNETAEDRYWYCEHIRLRCAKDGWLVWFRRVDGSVTFNRQWNEYAAGFGDPDGNYWLGLEVLHHLNETGTMFKLRVEMGSWHNPHIEWAEYDDFSIGGERTTETTE